MRAQNGKKHYEDKFQAEKKIVDEANANADVVVEEFNVCSHSPTICVVNNGSFNVE